MLGKLLKIFTALILLVITSATLLLSGCSKFSYYKQSVAGQWQLIRDAEPIEDVLKKDTLEPKLKTRLEYANQVRQFATSQLGLPDNGSYQYFVELDRDYVVWSITATPELNIQPKNWCFPIVGCVSYLGYFSEQQANQHASELKAQGMDVSVRGVSAYSTLGWFKDPLLSSMLRSNRFQLAGTVIHELTHQLIYIKDDTAFNEAFAVAVEEEGLKRWLAHLEQIGQPESDKAMQWWQASRERQKDFTALLLDYRQQLIELYQSDKTSQQKRNQKATVFAALKQAYQELRDGKWQGYSGYDRWFAQPLNNAHLASIASYQDLKPAFSQLLAENHYDLARFYRAVEKLSQQSKSERDQQLQALFSRAQASKPPVSE